MGGESLHGGATGFRPQKKRRPLPFPLALETVASAGLRPIQGDENRWVFDRAVIPVQRRGVSDRPRPAALTRQSRARQGAGPSLRRAHGLSLTFQASMRRLAIVKQGRRRQLQLRPSTTCAAFLPSTCSISCFFDKLSTFLLSFFMARHLFVSFEDFLGVFPCLLPCGAKPAGASLAHYPRAGQPPHFISVPCSPTPLPCPIRSRERQ